MAAAGTGFAEATSAASSTQAQHGPDSPEWCADSAASCLAAASDVDCDAVDGRSNASQIGRASTKESATSASATNTRRAGFRCVRE